MGISEAGVKRGALSPLKSAWCVNTNKGCCSLKDVKVSAKDEKKCECPRRTRRSAKDVREGRKKRENDRMKINHLADIRVFSG